MAAPAVCETCRKYDCSTPNRHMPILGGTSRIEITSAVVTVTMNAGGKGIRLEVTGDLSNVVWKLEGMKEEFRIPKNSFLQLNFDIVDDDGDKSRMSNLREGLDEMVVKKKKRAVGRKKK